MSSKLLWVLVEPKNTTDQLVLSETWRTPLVNIQRFLVVPDNYHEQGLLQHGNEDSEMPAAAETTR